MKRNFRFSAVFEVKTLRSGTGTGNGGTPISTHHPTFRSSNCPPSQPTVHLTNWPTNRQTDHWLTNRESSYHYVPNFLFRWVHASLYECLSVCLFVYLFVCLSVLLYVCLTVCLSSLSVSVFLFTFILDIKAASALRIMSRYKSRYSFDSI